MMGQDTYRAAIREAQSELDELARQNAGILQKMEELRAFIKVGRALAGQLGEAGRPLSVGDTVVVSDSAVAVVKPIADHVADVLRESPRPLRIAEIVDLLRKRISLSAKNPKDTVVTAIKRRGEQFKKVGPATYTLREGST